MEILVVGAGFAGAVCAERLASAGHRVTVIDKRTHIGGNAHDRLDEHGVLVHPYGPHIFHTNSKEVFDHLSRFTKWRFYEHRVLSVIGDDCYPFPINRTTLNRLYGLDLKSEAEAEAYFDRVREVRSGTSSEDLVLNCMGRDLCDTFYRGYSQKQWGLDLSQLSAGVAARIPYRTDTDDRYFTDDYQFMPADGYTEMFKNILDHPKIRVELGTDYSPKMSYDHLIYTGPIDGYFAHIAGPLPYRSLRFEHYHVPDRGVVQHAAVYNYPRLDVPYTRTTEFKYLTDQRVRGSSLVREYGSAEGDPYYPIPRFENQALYLKYRDVARKVPDTTFVGRLAEYRYYNMDQVVAAALHAVNNRFGITT